MPMPSSPKSLLLQQMAAITCMERGKLSTYRPKGRAADAGPYHKLQHWQDGKNQTRHVCRRTAAGRGRAGRLRKVRRADRPICRGRYRRNSRRHRRLKKKLLPSEIHLAQEEEIQQLIDSFLAKDPSGTSVAELEILVRTDRLQKRQSTCGLAAATSG